jgi:O-antigen/teichoic acid export membrane protein
MKTNMGSADRIIRTIVAAIFLTLYVTGLVGGTWGLVLVSLAVVFLLTSLVGTCPLYLPFGLNTLRKKFSGQK